MQPRAIVGIVLGVAFVGAFGVERYLKGREECCSTPPPRMTTVSAATTGADEPKGLALWEPVDSSFSGCAKSCGTGARGPRDDAHAQPGAKVGDLAYCPVSGATFRVREESAHRAVDGKVLYFCCEACATYFSSHQAEVLAKRSL
jgi:hypothetical protein